ncbi:hypothetical protein Deipr_2293 (plasmid) [Deinococcus proteolyticus MRP]|uniref:Uncharacterized protein n=1 Tax=Deinococcus proteolyticus (strain ATCC 35074 / DSM 20540 / JCM 6276 / NBRC 101906 / NCIMB 13154 / VKM Ac-1939 / CCM 2703 / MRP) TaxID=693977 RepID=F0RQ59_DEIPM|nr:hypothetical protein [Deinococcus proteolyticus]ADY27418.1 hypothetical protein Deipr_2293 [Deinococcus proteolyticus MRP]
MKYPKLHGWAYVDYRIRRGKGPSVGRQHLKRRTRRDARRRLNQEVAKELSGLDVGPA